MVYGIVTIGPAGVGKTTMCHALQIHGRLHKRGIYVVNLDPAADTLPYEPDIDVRELIRVEDAMRGIWVRAQWRFNLLHGVPRDAFGMAGR